MTDARGDETAPLTDETRPPTDESAPPTDETSRPTDHGQRPTDETAPLIDETRPLTDETGPPSPGPVLYLTGLSGSGKSTIAEALARALRAEAKRVEIVDGDVLRERDPAPLGFDRESRELQVRRAAELTAELAATGATVISALISPFETARREAREVIERSGARFLLVHVSTPLEVAEARDPKGHYRRARAGEIRDFTGIDSPYEPPVDPDLVIDTATTPVDEAVALLRALVPRH